MMVEEIKIGTGEQKEEPKKVLTKEEILAKKKEDFAKDPDMFVSLDSLIIAIRKNEKGDFESFVHTFAARFEMMYAKGEVAYIADKHADMLAMKARMEKKIQPAQPGAMRQFANKVMRKGR